MPSDARDALLKRVGGYTVDRWYDRHACTWVVQCKDVDGCQVGSSYYVGTKGQALSITVADFLSKKERQVFLRRA